MAEPRPRGTTAHRAAPRRAAPDATVWFAARRTEVPAARHHVVAALEEWGVDRPCVEDAELLVSELVANVVEHSGARAVGVEVEPTEGGVRVDIRESDGSEVPGQGEHLLTSFGPAAVSAPADVSGRGLKILDALAAEWGISRVGHRTSTWFTVVPAEPLPLEIVNPRAAAELRSVRAGLARTQMMLRVTEHLSAAVTAEEVGAAVTSHLSDYVGAMFTGIALVDVATLTSSSATMHYLDLSAFPEATRAEWARFPLASDAPVATVARSGRAEFHGDPAAAEAAHPGLATHMRTAGTGALAHLPLLADGVCLGTLALAWAAPREFDADTVALLTIVAGYAAQALTRRDRASDLVALARRRWAEGMAEFDAALAAGSSLLDLRRLDDEVRRAAAALARARREVPPGG